MIVDILGYREWASNVAKTVSNNNPGLDVHFHETIGETCHGVLTFAVGWSSIISDEMISSRTILVVHPSPLPKYRGGSPIQHQMLAGEKTSAVSIFKLEVGREIDAGPIAWQMAFPMPKKLDEVLKCISRLSVQGINACIKSYINDELAYIEQNDFVATSFKRRQPHMSELTIEELTSWPAWMLEAKVNCLNDPYPNAYINTADGGRLYITGVHRE